MEVLTLAIPTGRLFAETVALLQGLGMLREAPPERSLVFPAADNLRMLIAKPVDLLTYIEQGAADAGIVGKDLLLEQGRDVYELVDLGFGACRGVVALPEGQQERLWQPGGLLRIATKYPRISAAFFEEHHRPVELIELHGSVEVAPRVGLADGIVDLVMTGRTLRDNLLVEVAEIFRSTVRLAVNRASLRMKSDPMQRLIERLERASQARVGGPRGRPLSPRPEIASLQPYRVPETAPVKLNQNESALDWPDPVKAEVLRRVAARAWNRYPEVDSVRLREALASFHGTGPEMIAVTNGSNEAILALVEAFAGGRGIVLPVPGYSMVQRLASAGGATVRAITLKPDFSLDVDAVVEAVQAPDAAMVFLASPNNPTGVAFDRPSIEAVLEASSGLVVIDEAYAGFGGDSFIPDLAAFPHLAVLRTFSKAFALAGVRVGWIVANEPVVAAVRKVLPPYNLSIFAQEAALVALDHADLLEERIQLIVRERNRMSVAMAQIPGIAAYPSQTNFILFSAAIAPAVLYDRLLKRGVLVRDFSSAPLLDRCLRVTVGLPEENDRFLQALRASVGEGA